MNMLFKIGAAAFLALGPAAAAAGTPPAPAAALRDAAEYRIAPGDQLQIFVWKNPELSTEAPVRPDGKITAPLVQDLQAQGRTPSELAKALREALATYVQDPNVTVLVKTVAAPANASAIRVIGAAVTPKTVAYHSGLTLLDVVIEVGGLNTFASGNRAVLIRREDSGYHSYPLRLKDLVDSGDLQANMALQPGDIIRIPERWF